MKNKTVIVTVGHSRRTIEEFAELLTACGIACLAIEHRLLKELGRLRRGRWMA
jgi:hypothetical protein